MVLSQISNKLHKFQQITKQGKVNVQGKANGKNNFDFLKHICIFVYIYLLLLLLLLFFADYKYLMFCK